jgi:hypothetical protein
MTILVEDVLMTVGNVTTKQTRLSYFDDAFNRYQIVQFKWSNKHEKDEQ